MNDEEPKRKGHEERVEIVEDQGKTGAENPYQILV